MPKISEIEDHATQAAGKLRDVYEVHLPAVADFLARVRQNPLATAFEAVSAGQVGGDANALLNGIQAVLAARPAPAAAPYPAERVDPA